jgi:hypothetical protein
MGIFTLDSSQLALEAVDFMNIFVLFFRLSHL